MEIQPNTTTLDIPPQTIEPSDSDQLSSDIDTFLELLVAQLKNQDPLDPMETTEFSSQLAEYSSLEQQVKTNDLLESIAAQSVTAGMADYSTWIGLEGVAEMPVAYTGTAVTVQSTPADGADRMELVVTNLNGDVVQRAQVPLTDSSFTWDGIDTQGEPLPFDYYNLYVESYSGETLLDTQPASVAATIQEAQLRDGEVFLIMEGGVEVRSDLVTGLRAPEAT